MKFALLILAAVLSSPLKAQDSTVTIWTRHVIKSGTLSEERPIYVATPDGYRTGTNRYPVLIILDANDAPQFNLAVANVRFLASRNTIPPLIVVGIPNTGHRTHDLTPVATGSTAQQQPEAGGADRFEKFLIEEVVPFVRSKYRTLTGTILAGHSFGGLLALDVAAKRPGSFTGFIAMSPALWWNDSSVVESYSDAIVKSQRPQRIFVASGGLEPEIDRQTQRFALRLDSLMRGSAAIGHTRYPTDTHGLTPAPSLADGLRFVFEPISIAKLPISTLGPTSDSAGVVKALIESKRLYAIGARQFGLDERLPENQINSLGYNVLGALRNPGLAAWIFRQNVELYPESANTYDSLSDALIAKGDTAAAIVELRRALDLATRTKQPILAESLRKLNALEVSTTRRE